jgi:Glycosyltransferase like family 2
VEARGVVASRAGRRAKPRVTSTFSARAASYVLPLRWGAVDEGERAELAGYLRWLSERVEEIFVVDGSALDVFEANAGAWGSTVKHLPPDPDLRWLNGKVNGVVTGLRAATLDKVVIADDDVRYDDATLARLLHLLDDADVVRPQNYFAPVPWHARWDTARSLLNRAFAADYPGTLALRRGALGPEGYDGDVMFENLELLRTATARGARVVSALDLYVRRLPPSAAHFWSQRIRQAYDDFAIPPRMALWLSLLPAGAWCAVRRDARTPLIAALASMSVAELGRRRAGGRRFFPASSSAMAPLWIAERAVTSWLAVRQRFTGGCRYGGTLIPKAASSSRSLRRARR